MKGYKGFDKDFMCRGKQYEVGKTFTEDKAKICEYGMHFCKYPLDCLNYYTPNNSKYTEVEVEDDKVIEESNQDSKCVTTKLTVKSELNFIGLVKASVEYIKEKADNTKKQNYMPSENEGDYIGNRSAAINTSVYSAAINDGNYSVSANTGVCSIAINTGNYSVSANTGNRSTAINDGNCSAVTNTGDHSTATNTGNYSAATNTGVRSIAIAKGKNTAAFAFGPNSIAKGDMDDWIILSEWKENKEYKNFTDKYSLKDIKSFKVDGIDILPDTFYKLVNGQPVVVEEDELEKYN